MDDLFLFLQFLQNALALMLLSRIFLVWVVL